MAAAVPAELWDAGAASDANAGQGAAYTGMTGAVGPGEEQSRVEIRSRAEAELAEFHDRRGREIEEQKRVNRERNAAALPQEVPPPPLDVAALAGLLAARVGTAPGTGAGGLAAALLGGLGGGGGSGSSGAVGGASVPRQMLQSALANPAAAAALAAGMGQSGIGGAASVAAPSPATPAAAPSQPALAVRVRDAGGAAGAFRRVVLRPEGEAAPAFTFAHVESCVGLKFRSARGLDGAELGARRLVSLVRIQDSLVIGDDDDASLLKDGDELEATFVAAQSVGGVQ